MLCWGCKKRATKCCVGGCKRATKCCVGGVKTTKMTNCDCAELEARQSKGEIEKDVILLTVDDPKSNVGSGGATVNALLTVVEHISARQGFSVSTLHGGDFL